MRKANLRRIGRKRYCTLHSFCLPRLLQHLEAAEKAVNEGKLDADFKSNESHACPKLLMWKEKLLSDDSKMELKLKRKEQRQKVEEDKLEAQIRKEFNLPERPKVSSQE